MSTQQDGAPPGTWADPLARGAGNDEQLPGGYVFATIPPESERPGRITLRRVASGRCLVCAEQWSEGWALAQATNHMKATGHSVVGNYSADYCWYRSAGPQPPWQPKYAERILELLADGRLRSSGWLRGELGLRASGSLYRSLHWLIEHGQIKRVGSGRRTRYRRIG